MIRRPSRAHQASALALALALTLLPTITSAAPPTPATAGPAPPQDARALTYHRRRTTLGLAGMSTLTTWSLANIAGGTIGNFTTTGSAHYFHQGNAMWNSVNLVLGVVGIINETRARKRPVDLRAGRISSHKSQLAFIINAGLDVLYVSSGAVLWQLGPTARTEPMQHRLTGYGQALVLQGAFLFAFDVGMALAHELLPDGVRPANRTLSVAIFPCLEGGAMLGIRFQR